MNLIFRKFKALALSLGIAVCLFNPISAQETLNQRGVMCATNAALFGTVPDTVMEINDPINIGGITPSEYAIHFTVVRDENCADDRYKITIEEMLRVIKFINDEHYFYAIDPIDGISKPFINFVFGGAKFIINPDRAHLPDASPAGGNLSFTEDRDLSSLSPNIDAIKVYISDTPFSNARLPFLDKIGQNSLTKVNYANMIVLSEAKIDNFKNTFERELAHELGHYFGLLHTHEGTEPNPSTGGSPSNPEYADGSNSSTAGDKLTDTPADPNAKFCMPNSCNPIFCDGQKLDLNPNNPKTYEPDRFNLMGYYYPYYRCANVGQFLYSPLQKNIMRGIKADYFGKSSGISHNYRVIFANKNITPVIEDFHAGEFRKVKCDATLFANLIPIKDVTINFSSSPSHKSYTLSSDCGQYIGKNGMPNTGIQTVTPLKDNDHLNGVTMADAVATQRHLLGQQSFQTSYQMIAADLNNNGSISSWDIALIGRLVVGTDKVFRYVPSWRFLSQLHENGMPNFVNSNPFTQSYQGKAYLKSSTIPSYLDHVDINYALTDEAFKPINWSFKGIKMGDVDCSADAVVLAQSSNNGVINTPILSVRQNIGVFSVNKEVLVNVALNRNVPIEAYQLEFGYDAKKVQLIDIQQADNTKLSLENCFNTEVQGKIRTVWYSEDDNKLDSKPEYNLFQFRFQTLQEINNGNDILHLHVGDFHNAFYNSELHEVPATLILSAIEIPKTLGKISLKNNSKATVYPNPTSDEFNLSVQLEQASEINIQITDLFGRVVKSLSTLGYVGRNDILIDDLPNTLSGMIQYQIQTNEGNFQGKVLVGK